MKAIINSLNVKFNYSVIDIQYDFFTVTTTDKYISGGAYILGNMFHLPKICQCCVENLNLIAQLKINLPTGKF